MKIIDIPEKTVVIADDQPQYIPIPAHQFGDAEGRIAFCWGLSWCERLRVLWTGHIWHQVLTFNTSLQPQKLTVEKPDMNASVSRENS